MMARRLLPPLAAAAMLLLPPSAATAPPIPAYWEHVQATDATLMSVLGTATVTEAGFLGVTGPLATKRIELSAGSGMVTGPNVFAVIPAPVVAMTWTFWLKNDIECATNGGITLTPCVLLRVRSETRTEADYFAIRWSSANRPPTRSVAKGRLLISVVTNEAGKPSGPFNLCSHESALITLAERTGAANPTFNFVSIAVLPGADPATKEIRVRLNGVLVSTEVCGPRITGGDVMSRPPPSPVQTNNGPWQQGADVGGEGHMYIGALHAAQLAPTVVLTEAVERATIDGLKVYPFAVDDVTAFCCAEAGRSRDVCGSLPLNDEACASYPPYEYAPTRTATATASAVVTLTDTPAEDDPQPSETQPPTEAPGTVQSGTGRWPTHVSSKIFLRQMKAVGVPVPVPQGRRGLGGLWEEGPMAVRHQLETLQPPTPPQALAFPTTTSAGSSAAQVGVVLGTGVLVLLAAWAVVRALPARGPCEAVVPADC